MAQERRREVTASGQLNWSSSSWIRVEGRFQTHIQFWSKSNQGPEGHRINQKSTPRPLVVQLGVTNLVKTVPYYGVSRQIVRYEIQKKTPPG